MRKFHANGYIGSVSRCFNANSRWQEGIEAHHLNLYLPYSAKADSPPKRVLSEDSKAIRTSGAWSCKKASPSTWPGRSRH